MLKKLFQLVSLTVDKDGRDVAFIPDGNVAQSQNRDWAIVQESGSFRRVNYPTDEEISEMLSQGPMFPFVKRESEL